LVSKTQVQGSFVVGDQTIFEYIISNVGKAETGILTITLPAVPGVSLITPTTIPSLLPKESFSIFFSISPQPLTKRDGDNTVVTTVIVSSESAFLSDSLQVTSTVNTTGTVIVSVVDDQSELPVTIGNDAVRRSSGRSYCFG
jgi:hypothetical protein